MSTYTVVYNLLGKTVEVTTSDADFALWLSVEKKQNFHSHIISARELLLQYTSSAYELFLQEQKIKNILIESDGVYLNESTTIH